MTDKIRPKSAQQFRAESEAELPDTARAPDIGGVRLEDMGNGTLSAQQAAAARATHGEPNRLGKPQHSEAEELLAAYQSTRAAWKESYRLTRDSQATEEAQEKHFDAKRAMIRAGLMQAE
jgi:hypothetical protein